MLFYYNYNKKEIKLNRDDYFSKEINKKKEECKNLIEEISSLKYILEEDIDKLNELIEEIEIDPNILNVPKFKGQTVFEKYLEIIESRKRKKIKNKRKIIGLIEKNDIFKTKKDINKLKEFFNNEKK
jgi:predicted N-acyltransferase